MKISERTVILLLLVALAASTALNLVLGWRSATLESQISALMEQVRGLLDKIYVKGPF